MLQLLLYLTDSGNLRKYFWKLNSRISAKKIIPSMETELDVRMDFFLKNLRTSEKNKYKLGGRRILRFCACKFWQ
jgi:hypothetical protein